MYTGMPAIATSTPFFLQRPGDGILISRFGRLFPAFGNVALPRLLLFVLLPAMFVHYYTCLTLKSRVASLQSWRSTHRPLRTTSLFTRVSRHCCCATYFLANPLALLLRRVRSQLSAICEHGEEIVYLASTSHNRTRSSRSYSATAML